MIITPKELFDRKSEFTVIDIRPETQRNEWPMNGLNPIISNERAISDMEGKKVLVCQFGIVTEGMIIEHDLKDTFSLLGGAKSWIDFQSEKDDLSRWSRQMVLPEMGLEGQKKLMAATVAVVGLGGLGCPASQVLVSAGIGKIVLIDGDIVELSNLHRQPLYGINDIGKMKVHSAKEALKKIQSVTVIETIDVYLNEYEGLDMIEKCDVVIDATDNIKSRRRIDRLSKNAKVPMIYGGLYRWEGQVSILNVDGSPGYQELFPNPISGGDTCEDAGVLGMLPGIIGHMQALEAVKIIVGIEPNLVGKLLMYDGMNHKTQIIEI